MTIRKAVVSYDTDTKKYALLEISPFGDHQLIVSGIELSSELGEEIRRWFTQGEES